jgi:hypothetical protein
MATLPALRENDANHKAKSPSTKIEGSMTRVVHSAPQYPARNPPWWQYILKYLGIPNYYFKGKMH